MRRPAGILIATAGLIGVVACCAGSVGCWYLHNALNQRLDGVSNRANDVLAKLGGDATLVRDRLIGVRRDLDAVRDPDANRSSRPTNDAGGRRPLAARAMASVGKQLGDVQPQIVRAVGLGMMANGLLDASSDLWLAERAGIDTDRLQDASDRFSGVLERARRFASSLEGRPDQEAIENLTNLSESVALIVTIADQTADRATAARERLTERERRTRQNITFASVIATVILVWMGVGQVSLILHGREIGRRGAPVAAN
jgi:hypothetical protein